jgi:hypothetical protein
MEGRYETGKGLFGGPGGTYGRYSVGSRVTAEGKNLRNLSTQFSRAEEIEAKQRRRFGRKREPGYTGEGYWFQNYPNRVGTLTAGTDPHATGRKLEKPKKRVTKPAEATNGAGNGGTAAGFIGGLGT